MACSSVSKGEVAKFLVTLRAYEKNYTVSFPTTESSRYDAIIDTGTSLLRAQIKFAGVLRGKKIRLLLYRPHHNTKPYTKKDIDILLVFVPAVNSILAFKWFKFHNKKEIVINLADPKDPNYYKKYQW